MTDPAGRVSGRTAGASRATVATAVAVAVAVVVVDQVTKSLAVARLGDGPVELFWTLRLNLTFNSGIAFSLGAGFTPWITATALLLVAALLVLTNRVSGIASAAAIGLVLGGALGNLADRLFRGHGGAVVDFIDLQWWPVFNVADIGITAGALLFVVASATERSPDG